MRGRATPIAFRWWARAFALASLVHVTLPDFEVEGWGLPGMIEAAGALWLLARPHPMAFAICALGTLWTLVGLNDVLTQSMYLTWAAVIGGLSALTGRHASALGAVRALTAGTYLLAAIHKINTDYLSPETSCAVHAWEQAVGYFRLPELAQGLDPIMPALSILLELALAWLIWRGSPWRWPLGALFHAPLTVTLAPAFAAVTMSGYVAGASPREAVAWRRLMARPAPTLLGGAAVAVLALVAHGEWVWAHGLKLMALGVVAIGGAQIALTRHPRRRPALTRGARIALALWLAHGLTPYLGLQYQHTAAMLSNMRIDTPCHNSLLFPEALVIQDPYLRIEAADFGGGQRPKRAATLKRGLWSPTALHTMARNWCVPHLRPIRLAGTWRGREFVIEDLCDKRWTEKLDPGPLWPSASWLPRYITLQKNLTQQCRQSCIH